jgi:hypothetical protein
MILYKKDILAVIILTILFFISGLTNASLDQQGSVGYKQSAQDYDQHQADQKNHDFTCEKIDIDTYKVTFTSSKLVNVFKLEKGCYLTILDVSNPIMVLQFYPEAGKVMPVDIGVKAQTYADMPLEFKAEKGEYVIFKYEKP